MAEHERGKDSVIWLDLGQNYRLKATAEEHLKPPQLHDGEAPHGFEDTQGRDLVSYSNALLTCVGNGAGMAADDASQQDRP
eukprot:2995738-Rhodomonas_salina.2